MSDFKVGDRVQWEDRDDSRQIYPGMVDSIIPARVSRPSDYWNSKYSEAKRSTWIVYANIKWDDGTEDSVDMTDLDPEDTELEREFRVATIAADDEIQKYVSEANAALTKAVEVSEKYGVPFDSSVSFLGQSYFPTTFSARFSEVSSDFVCALTEAYSDNGDCGWEHSDVC